MVKGRTRKFLISGVFGAILMAVFVATFSRGANATQFDMSIKSYMTVDFPSFIFIDASPNYGGIQTADAKLRVSTNEDGYTVIVSADGNSLGEGDTSRTSLVSNSENATIPTLTSASNKLNFPVGYWGFSIDGGENYRGITTYDDVNRLTLSSDQPGVSTVTDFTFGVRINDVQPAGVYNNTILITAVANVQDIPDPADVRAKAILGNTGHLVFTYDDKIYEVGEAYTNSYTSMVIDDIYSVPLFPTDDVYSSLPWLNEGSNITSVDFETSFEFFKPVSTKYWFYNLANLTDINGIEYFNTSNTTNMSYMFFGAFQTSETAMGIRELSKLDVGNVADMSYMFARVGRYGSTSTWDSNTESRRGEILSIGNWDTSSVEDMSYMFSGFASGRKSHHFIGNLGGWDTSNVKNMSHMFEGVCAYSHECITDTYDYNIGAYVYYGDNLDFHTWDVGNVTNMNGMFYELGYNTYYSSTFSINVDGWDVRKVTNITEIFYQVSSYVTITANDWKLDSLQTARRIFAGAGTSNYISYYGSKKSSLTASLRNWRIGPQGGDIFEYGPFSMYFMSNAALRTVDIDASGWDISAISKANLRYVFNGIGNIKSLNLSGWTTSGATNLSYAFANNAGIENINLTGWDTSSVTNMEGLFSGSHPVKIVGIEAWNTSSVTNMKKAFYGVDGDLYADEYRDSRYYNDTDYSLAGWDVSNVTDMTSMFEDATLNDRLLSSIEGWNPAKVQTMASMFKRTQFGRTNIPNSVGNVIFDLTGWNTPMVTNTSRMFENIFIRDGSQINLSGWDTSALTNAYMMFANMIIGFGYNNPAAPIRINLSDWDTTGITDTTRMFGDTRSPWINISENPSIVLNINLSGWDTSNVVHMDHMFSSGYPSDWNYDEEVYRRKRNMLGFVTIIDGIEDFDTRNVETMSHMFEGFSTDRSIWNYDFSNWDTSKVTDMSYTFAGLEAQDNNRDSNTVNTTVALDFSSLDTSSVQNMMGMFLGAGEYVQTFSLDLSGLDTSSAQNMSYMLFSTGKSSKNVSIDISGWNVSNVTNHAFFTDRLELVQPNWQ